MFSSSDCIFQLPLYCTKIQSISSLFYKYLSTLTLCECIMLLSLLNLGIRTLPKENKSFSDCSISF